MLLWGGSGIYAVGATSLYFAWYKDYDQDGFHFFNDWGEWNNMDKAGHVFSAYSQTLLVFKGAQWAGYSNQQSLMMASASSLLFQSIIEIMDGFSSAWGFSITDLSANFLGTSAFYIQEKLWNEQRIKFKMSYWPEHHPSEIIVSETGLFSFPLEQRANQLYGSGALERILKDYNGQTIWASVNIHSFAKNSTFPKWLNVALGFSSANMYGGFSNRWELNDENIIIDPVKYPRSKQYVLALDYDLSKIRTDSPFLKTVFDVLDIIKWPAPAIEYSSVSGWRFHLVFTN